MDYRRRLPHVFRASVPVFLTWRLRGSLPANRVFPNTVLTSREAFAAMERLVDHQHDGARFLANPCVAEIVVAAIHYNAEILGHYRLHAFAVMSNHVHLLATPAVPIPMLTRSLKSITAKRANQLLGRIGEPFWEEETFDRNVRNSEEFHKIQSYIENNPVKAGLVLNAPDYRWSSAWKAGPPSRAEAPASAV